MSGSRITPAQLSFLAIYNPSLGKTDETFRDQVVFYYSRAARARRKRRDADADSAEREAREEENEKLRQIGLAQGMVGFAQGFADGESMDSVETEKQRVVLKELEEGWWILASIDLTRLPVHTDPNAKAASSSSPEPPPTVEYSSREVSPAPLLLQQLLRAHRTFKLHNGSSLSGLYNRLKRDRFCNALDRHWARFAANWDVLLHGNPAVDIYDDIKLSAGGELGIGVGEEEWGSGEREVFEDFAGRTDGLVDMVVSRFGDVSPDQMNPNQKPDSNKKSSFAPPEILEPWMGAARNPGPADGVIFSGVGAISRTSLRDVSEWIKQIYAYGDHAYGVRDNPRSERRRRRRKEQINGESKDPEDLSDQPVLRRVSTREHPSIPPPIIAAAERSLNKASAGAEADQKAIEAAQEAGQTPESEDKWTKYLTLGYGSAWGPGTGRKPEAPTQTLKDKTKTKRSEEPPPATRSTEDPEAAMTSVDPEPEGRDLDDRIRAQVHAENSGHFVVGLKGSLDDEAEGEDDDLDGTGEWNSRLFLRTLHVEVIRPLPPSRTHSNGSGISDDLTTEFDKRLTRLRVVVYVHRPFIYAFLFHQHTASLSMAAFYRNIHTFFAPLHRPLNSSTDPQKVATRIATASSAFSSSTDAKVAAQQQPIFDLVHDPEALTLHTSIPSIPEPGTLGAEGLGGSSLWTRVEALNVHSQILAAVAATRSSSAADQLEWTAKTSRGWWVVWMRINPASRTTSAHNTSEAEPDATAQDDSQNETSTQVATSEKLLEVPSVSVSQSSTTTLISQHYDKDSDVQISKAHPNFPEKQCEAILIRKSRDAASSSGAKSGFRGASGMWTSMGLGTGSPRLSGADAQQTGWGPSRLAEGIGVDARRYIEGLLSLNR